MNKGYFSIILCIGLSMVISSRCYIYAGTIAELSMTVKNISNNTVNNGNITWSGVANNGTTSWKHADQYLEIHYKSDYQGWGIQIFTDNIPVVPADTPPYPYTARYVWVPEDMPENIKTEIRNKIAGDFAAGLVHDEGKHTLPMCWRVIGPRAGSDPFTVAEQAFELSIEEAADADSNTGWHHLKRFGDTNNYYCWIYMKDKGMDGWSDPISWTNPITGNITWLPNNSIKWTNGGQYQTVVCSQGVQHAEGTFEGWGIHQALDGQNDGLYGIIVYLGAKFKNIAGGDFRTRIYVEMYHY